MSDEIRLVCPSCQSPDGLWAAATFTGWHSVDVTLSGRRELTAVRRGYPYCETTRDLDCLDPFEMGCSCSWEGASADLVRLDRDGNPFPDPIPGQEAFEMEELR